jgi:hypothetical protein
VPVRRHLQKGQNLKDEALSDNVRLYSVSTVTAVTRDSIFELLGRFTVLILSIYIKTYYDEFISSFNSKIRRETFK